MKIQRGPYYLVIYNSKIPVFLGNRFDDGPFEAATLGPLIFVPGSTVRRQAVVHERNHVKYWWLCLGIAWSVWAIFGLPLLVWPVSLFAYSIAYAVAGFVAMKRGGNWYEDNWFERRARNVAGEIHKEGD